MQPLHFGVEQVAYPVIGHGSGTLIFAALRQEIGSKIEKLK